MRRNLAAGSVVAGCLLLAWLVTMPKYIVPESIVTNMPQPVLLSEGHNKQEFIAVTVPAVDPIVVSVEDIDPPYLFGQILGIASEIPPEAECVAVVNPADQASAFLVFHSSRSSKTSIVKVVGLKGVRVIGNTPSGLAHTD